MLNRLKGVFKSFQQHDVRYVVIGGIAAVLYGVPRATFDLDILIEATPENAQRLLDALIDAGMGTATLTNSDEILANEITIFKDRVRLAVFVGTVENIAKPVLDVLGCIVHLLYCNLNVNAHGFPVVLFPCLLQKPQIQHLGFNSCQLLACREYCSNSSGVIMNR